MADTIDIHGISANQVFKTIRDKGISDADVKLLISNRIYQNYAGHHQFRNDPSEWSPAMPDGALLTLRQCEQPMNLVKMTTPVGVQASTWELRQRHVDVDASGTPFPLIAAAARTYRRYYNPR